MRLTTLLTLTALFACVTYAKPDLADHDIVYNEYEDDIPQCGSPELRAARRDKKRMGFDQMVKESHALGVKCGISSPLVKDDDRCFPTFIMVGCMKCASTFTNYYMQRHKHILYHQRKEQTFFHNRFYPDRSKYDTDEKYMVKVNSYRGQLCVPHFTSMKFRELEEGMQCHLALNDQKQWHIPEDTPSSPCVIGESTPLYFNPPNIEDRIYEFLPDTKILFSLRSPTERTFSQYNHGIRFENLRKGQANGILTLKGTPFEEITRQEIAVLQQCFGDMLPSKDDLPTDWLDDHHEGNAWVKFVENDPEGGWESYVDMLKKRTGKGSSQFPNYSPCAQDCSSCFPDVENGSMLHEQRVQGWLGVTKSIYYQFVDRYVKKFGEENVLVLHYAEITQNPPAAFKKLEDFVGMGHHEWDTNFEPQWDNHYGLMKRTSVQFMQKFFEPFNKKLWSDVLPNMEPFDWSISLDHLPGGH